MDKFQIKKSAIKEVKRNRMPLGSGEQYFEAFHIRLQNGVNFNFAVVDDQGRGLSPDPLLMALTE
jgi:hypothetical protein